MGLGRQAFTAAAAICIALLAALQQFLTPGSMHRSAVIVAAAALAAAVVAYAAWPRRRERLARRMLEPAMYAKDIKLLLGEPDEALEVFPGPVATRWIYSSRTMAAGMKLGITLAVDFDSSDRVMRAKRL